jgi:HD-like signal output (HDOD) protein
MTPNQLIQGVAGLVSLPEVCIRISEMVDSPYCSASDMGKVISKDAALTARLLRIVNSAFYRLPAKVETVSRAITIVGNRELRDLVLAATVAGIFERISSELIDIDSFWRHGIYCGTLSRLIASKCRVLHDERLFVAGLIHDIGRLIMAYKIPEQATAALRYASDKNVSIENAENEMIGFNHAEVGAELMKAWNLPDSHILATRFHHHPEQAENYILEASIINLANAITDLAESGDQQIDGLHKISSSVWKITTIRPTEIESLLLEARDQFIDALLLFRPKGRRSSSSYAA